MAPTASSGRGGAEKPRGLTARAAGAAASLPRPLPLVAACLALALCAGPQTAAAKELTDTNGTIKVGMAAPPVEAVDLDGKPFSLSALKGRPVLLDFGSVICEACVEMVGEMNRIKKKYASTDLATVTIVDGSMPVDMTKPFFTRLGATFTVVRNGDWSIFDAYGVTVVPFLVLVDRGGKIVNMHLGLRKDLEAVLGIDEALK